MGQLIHLFPPAPTRLVIKPREPEAKTFWFSGGELYYNAGGTGVHLEPAQAITLREAYANEAATAYEARSMREARTAVALYRELTSALDALDAYCRAVGKRSPVEPMGAVRDALTVSAAVVGDGPEAA